MKAYTDLKQSRKLAKILPIESADMVFTFSIKEDTCIPDKYPSCRKYSELYKEFVSLGFSKEHIENLICPCWSLAALLSVMICPNLEEYIKGKWDLTTFTDESLKTPIEVQDCEGAVDACYEMIFKLSEQNFI